MFACSFIWGSDRVSQFPPEPTEPSWPLLSEPDFDEICWAQRGITKPEWSLIKTNMDEMSSFVQQSLFPCLNRWLQNQGLVDLVRTNDLRKVPLYESVGV